MQNIVIQGGQTLSGSVPISGAKNAALPLMIASLLTDQTLELSNVPALTDVATLKTLLKEVGVSIKTGRDKHHLSLTAARLTNTTIPYEQVSTMRAGFWAIGPILARTGEARAAMPGGCAIGTRPVNFHLDGLKAMGATIRMDGGDIHARAPGGLRGAHIRLPQVSVGATHTLMMAATLARGETVIENAAREPEIADLARCLVKMGARIDGINTATLTIQPGDSLQTASHTVMPDRIEAATFAIAAAITGGDILLENANADLFAPVLEAMSHAGIRLTPGKGGIRAAAEHSPRATDIITRPWPGFPTDLQAQWMALMSVASGTSHITETIFENRFMHVQELIRLGADVSLSGQNARVNGVKVLHGAPVMATDLRASASLLVAALAARGTTTISRVYHLDRGFENLESKLAACGATIGREKT